MLFYGSIKYNIALCDSEMPDIAERLERAARAVHAHDVIESLPDKYETQVFVCECVSVRVCLCAHYIYIYIHMFKCIDISCV